MDEETGSHKGYGFATVVEILSASLQQGSFLKQLNGVNEKGQLVPYGLGHFFMAIDIECFTDIESFKKTTGDILRGLRASKKGGKRAHLYLRRERVSQLAEEQGPGCARGRRHSEGTVRDAR